MNYSCPLLTPVLLLFVLGGIGAFAENPEKPQPVVPPVIQGEIPDGWEVVPDSTGETVTHVLELKNGETREVKVPRMILRPVGLGEQRAPSNQASLRVARAITNQGEHLANSQSEMRSVLNRMRILLNP